MRFLSKTVAPLLLLLLSGCASVDANLPATSAVETGFGYVSSLAYTSTSDDFALILQNTASGKRYGLPLGGTGTSAQNLADKVTAIKVPPGQYKLINWSSDSVFVAPTSKASEKPHVLSETFQISAGSVTILGRFILDTNIKRDYVNGYVLHRIRTGRISAEEAQASFLAAYPLLKLPTITCIACAAY